MRQTEAVTLGGGILCASSPEGNLPAPAHVGGEAEALVASVEISVRVLSTETTMQPW